VTDATNGESQDAVALPTADEQLLRELTERARTGGLKLTGEGGLLGKLTKIVVEGALEGELDDHLGYEKNEKNDAAGVMARIPVAAAALRGCSRMRAGSRVGVMSGNAKVPWAVLADAGSAYRYWVRQAWPGRHADGAARRRYRPWGHAERDRWVARPGLRVALWRPVRFVVLANPVSEPRQ
jgi:hypothetical protein